MLGPGVDFVGWPAHNETSIVSTGMLWTPQGICQCPGGNIDHGRRVNIDLYKCRDAGCAFGTGRVYSGPSSNRKVWQECVQLSCAFARILAGRPTSWRRSLKVERPHLWLLHW